MRAGVRLQIVLALSGLLVLAFVPLFVAVASLTQASLRAVRVESASVIGHAVAERVARARPHRSADELGSELSAWLGSGAVEAIGVYDRGGAPFVRVGAHQAFDALPESASDDSDEHVTPVSLGTVRALTLTVPIETGAVAVVLRTDADAGRAASLVRLVALYTGVFALALLVFAYAALGRLIVQPLEGLSTAARRVAEGARELAAPRSGPAEMMDLGASLRAMTQRLRADEERMREQIAELERRARELRAAQDRLVRSERLASVGRLAAGLAHEVGNPIAALMGLEDLLLSGGLDPAEQRDFLERMRRETERIHRILRDLLDFARPAAAGSPTADLPGSVAEALNDVVALVRPQKVFRDVDLDAACAPDLPAVALGRERIVQVLLNLLLNAADATGGAGHVRVRAELEPNRRAVHVSVEDDGPGVDPSVAPRLFEPFVTTKEVGKGTGLGLAVCRGLVEAAGGTIALDESAHRGARFVVVLPVAGEPSEHGGSVRKLPALRPS